MTLRSLMADLFTRVAALIDAGWTGEIIIRIRVNQGGIRDSTFSQEERLTSSKEYA